MIRKQIRDRLPGWLASGLAIAVTSLWTYWSMGEMYHEGWWGAWYNRLPYLVPGAACLALTPIALRWPRLGGWLIIVIGGAFTALFLGRVGTGGSRGGGAIPHGTAWRCTAWRRSGSATRQVTATGRKPAGSTHPPTTWQTRTYAAISAPTACG